MFAMAASGVLLAVGCHLIADWRRKRLPPGWTVEEADPATFDPNAEVVLIPPDPRSIYERAVEMPVFAEPQSELDRHLSAALSVMLRHPELSIDAGTLRLLARKPPRTRGPDGKFKSGRA